MSITKLKTLGHWALPINNNTNADRPLAGRVIVGMLTGNEGPDHDDVITSAKKKRSTRR